MLMRRALISTALLALLAGCAPTVGPSAASQSAPPAAPKVLTIVGREGLIVDLPGQAGRTPLGNSTFVHDGLVAKDLSDAIVGRVGEPLSVDKGTWKLNADGTMVTTWKLRPNIKWQDGKPFSSEDMMFTYTAFKDPDLPSRFGEPLKLMTSAEAPDPLTFIVHWSAPYATANEGPGLIPLPKHLLVDLYTNDKANFGDTTFYHRDFVGLGSHKIVDWQPGSHVEFGRFGDYYLGRPVIDKVVLRFMSDPNTIVANLLTGTLDMVFSKDLVDTEAALEIRRRWEGTDNRVQFFPSFRVISVEIQFKPEFARPANGLTNRDVRQALTHAIDRVALNDAVTQGLSPLADSWIAPHHALASIAAPVAPKFPYDVNRAKQLLAQAGWTTTGSDGILINAATGERFETDLWNRFALQKDQAIIADNWKTVGVQATVKQLPQTRDRELETKITGGQMMDQTVNDYTYNGRVGTLNLATAANRFTGRNISGYTNPKIDDLFAKLLATIDDREAANLHRDIVREAFNDVALIPIYFQITPLLMRGGVTGPESGSMINFYQWDRKS